MKLLFTFLLINLVNVTFAAAAPKLECSPDQKDMGCCEKDVFLSDTGEKIDWQLSDNGAGGSWTGTPYSITFTIANSNNCGGSAGGRQSGSAIMNFHTAYGITLQMSMSGIAESQYEKFTLFIDGTKYVKIQASNTNTCQVSTCNMCEVQMPDTEFPLAMGQHEIRVDVDTIDGYYHKDALFKIEFAVKEVVKEACHKCLCPDPALATLAPTLAPTSSPTNAPTNAPTWPAHMFVPKIVHNEPWFQSYTRPPTPARAIYEHEIAPTVVYVPAKKGITVLPYCIGFGDQCVPTYSTF